jgi:hypothetical protein
VARIRASVEQGGGGHSGDREDGATTAEGAAGGREELGRDLARRRGTARPSPDPSRGHNDGREDGAAATEGAARACVRRGIIGEQGSWSPGAGGRTAIAGEE